MKVYVGSFATKRDAEAADEEHRVTQRGIKAGDLQARNSWGIRHGFGCARFGDIGMNLDTRAWYARYASPFVLIACVSVGGMPVTPKMLEMMIACPSSASRDHGPGYASPATAYPSHTHHSRSSSLSCEHDASVAAASFYGKSETLTLMGTDVVRRFDVGMKCLKAFSPTTTCLT